MSIVIAIIVFGVIVLFHELGHFLFAKLNNVKVNEFSLGLGPTLFGIRKGETLYSIKLLPFGGACVMEGEDGESSEAEGTDTLSNTSQNVQEEIIGSKESIQVDEHKDVGRSFNDASILGRMSIVFAGPFFNFIMAFVFLIIVIMASGYDTTKIVGVSKGSAAAEANIQPGDDIISIDGKNIHFFSELSTYRVFHPNKEIDLKIERKGKVSEVKIAPKYDKKTKQYLYGIAGGAMKKNPNILDATIHSVYKCKYYVDTTISSLKLLVTGKVSANEMSGPVGIVKDMGSNYNETKAQGGMQVAILFLLSYAALLSVNLGVMNLLPIPALDGGRLFFLIIEAIMKKVFKKEVDREKEGLINFVGIALLLGLMVLVMFNDIRKIVI